TPWPHCGLSLVYEEGFGPPSLRGGDAVAPLRQREHIARCGGGIPLHGGDAVAPLWLLSHDVGDHGDHVSTVVTPWPHCGEEVGLDTRAQSVVSTAATPWPHCVRGDKVTDIGKGIGGLDCGIPGPPAVLGER